MKKNCFGNFLMILVVIFLGLNKISAATLSIQNGNSEYGSNKVFNKLLDNNAAYCISGFDVDPQNNVCNITTTILNEEQRKVIGQIINNKCSGGCSGFGSNYAITEITIFEYLEKFDSSIVSSADSDTETTAKNIYEAAEAEVSRINNTSTNITLSTNKLNFELQDNFYVSNTISVSNSGEIQNINFSATGVQGIEVVKTSNTAYIKVPFQNVTQNANITLNVSGSKSYPIAEVYDCSVGQDVLIQSSYLKTGTASATGQIIATANLTVNKVDANNQPVVGAKIKITGPNNYSLEYVTDGTSKVLNNLPFGKYVIEEVTAPEGYTISQNKEITLSQTNLNGVVTLTDTKIKTIFSKLDATGKNELPGATLEIQDEKGNIVKLCPGTEGEEKTECKWISTDKPFVIEGLPNGKYYLVETIAPDKYVLNKEKVEFIIDGSKSLVEVKMQNRLNQVKISKLSVATKGELPGATLEIQDEEGIVVKYCKDANGNENKACKWVSTDEAYVIEGMPNGTYYLVETLAPKGYVLNKEKVKFVVDGNKSIVEVEMKNELEVEVPDTLSSRSALLVAISMFDIALGIGILTYVKKNKIEE